MACCCKTYIHGCCFPYCPPHPPTHATALACALCAKQKGKAKWTLSNWNIAPAAVKCAPSAGAAPPPSAGNSLNVPLYAKCVAVVICADHPQLGPAVCRRRPQLCLGTARLGVTVLQENSFSEFHLHFLLFCCRERGRERRTGGEMCLIFSVDTCYLPRA